MNVRRRLIALEKAEAARGGACVCSPPVIAWDPQVRAVLAPNAPPARAVLAPNAPPARPAQPASDRCRRCGRRREVIRVVFENTLPLEALP